ncbi:MAG TPA: L,D-transpeptidase family protein [Solirubrobacteraceae bacterium]|nr:L,D-transpeptidase family protein [Solirubrobacteraceae bacterium]
MRRAAATIVACLSLALPAVALGQAPAAPAPPPAPGAVSLTLERVHRVGRDDVVLRGDRVRVRGVVAPFVPGQAVVVRLYRGRTKLAAKAVKIKPIRGGTKGGFVASLKAERRGRLTVRASHRATAAQESMVAKARHVLVVSPHAAAGARGPVVRLLQRRLAGLHYAVSSSGLFDAATARAVVAYRKVTGMSRVALASATLVRALLRGRGTFKPRYPGHGKHVEVDLSRQVLALVERGRVYRIFGVSSGKASTPTVLGRFHVYSKTYGTNAKGMVHTSYFIGGYAVHGYASVPTFPASHGCVRVPIPNALFIFGWLRVGDRVDIYP